ncbi:hypothetical protein HMPREF1871_01180 [Gemelliphila asaccharolytica]|uniref:Uncharacterized protein n=1 Tax=Gemelliphila asaccharolytica TaxID=502393 RepID=A0ABR5TKG4_9BACL|nr:hypothetical protein HMPREF1871_01180 [Gemella asaccharolytica]
MFSAYLSFIFKNEFHFYFLFNFKKYLNELKIKIIFFLFYVIE